MLAYYAVWIDHNEARIYAVSPTELHSEVIKAHPHPLHGRRIRQTHHAEADEHFFGEVAGALAHADELLVVGPGTAKLQFVRWLHKHRPQLENKVVSVESADHPSDGQMFAYAKKYFHTDEQPDE